MKGQKGITLVALVITIIILVILAGISIGALKNTNLFTRAQEAKEKSDAASQNEANTLDEYSNTVNELMDQYK